MLAVFCSPLRYTQGKSATLSLGPEMRTLGLDGPALVLAGTSARRLLESVWRETFRQAGITYGVQPFSGECSSVEIERVKHAATSLGARVIIGAGGGKVLDTARAVASDLSLPVVNCPTVASSDAPCSALSVVYTEQGEFQEYRIYARNPDLVLVDTEVIAQSPPRLLVAGMGDALATMFEAKTCIAGNIKNTRGGASTQSALALAELCYRTLLSDGVAALDALEKHTVTPALERLVEANTLLSGLGFESSGLAAAHSVHNGLTAAKATHPYFHGEKVAFGVLVQLIMEEKPRQTMEEVLAFSTSVNLPITLADVGLANAARETFSQVANRATAAGETIHNEPFPVTPAMVEEAIHAADAAGRAFRKERA